MNSTYAPAWRQALGAAPSGKPASAIKGGRGGQHFSMRGSDAQYRLEIDFLEAVNGAKKRITLPDGGTLDVTLPAGTKLLEIGQLDEMEVEADVRGGRGDALVDRLGLLGAAELLFAIGFALNALGRHVGIELEGMPGHVEAQHERLVVEARGDEVDLGRVQLSNRPCAHRSEPQRCKVALGDAGLGGTQAEGWRRRDGAHGRLVEQCVDGGGNRGSSDGTAPECSGVACS